jgi:PilZ domain
MPLRDAFENDSPTEKERREGTRVVHDTTVECIVGSDHVLEYLVNLSPFGAAIRAQRLSLPVGTPLTLRFRIPGTPVKSEISARVVRADVDEDGSTIAVRFFEVNEHARIALLVFSQAENP